MHRELTNIFLIATKESNCHYCYCRQTNKCILCQLCSFLYAAKDQQIDGLPPKKFLQKFYNDRVKLEKYTWSLRNYQEGTYSTMTLDEIIDSDKIFVRNNPKLFDPEFIKRHPNCF